MKYISNKMEYRVIEKHEIQERKDEITNGDFDIFEGLSDGDLLGMSYFIDNVIGTLD